MSNAPNLLRWDGSAGHYEVYYLTLTDPATGAGVWIRYTMVAPLPGTGDPPTAALWFVVTDPRAGRPPVLARKATLTIDHLHGRADPFELRVADAVLTDERMAGAFDDVAWDLRWTPSGRRYGHVHPLLERLGAADTVLELPHADLSIDGWVQWSGERLELAGARGGQAHLWGSKHARSWAWVHCNDLRTAGGEPAREAFVDAVSVSTTRAGREFGPVTPVVGRFEGQDFRSISPVRVLRNRSSYSLTGWRFEAADRTRKLIVEVDADRQRLAGVTYRDPVRRARLLLQHGNCLDPPAPVRASPARRRVGARRRPARARPRAFRVRAADPGARAGAAPEVRLPAPFYARDEHVAIALPGAEAVFTTRRGGFSEGPYASLNLGRLTDDRRDAVRRNRARLQERVGVRPAHVRQVHGTVVRTVTDSDDPFVAPLPDGGIELPEADGQATRVRGVAPMVLTADCLPIAVAGRARNGAEDGAAVVMLHAGWRGLAGGIVAAGVRAVRDLGADGPLEAAIGPGAGGCCYEVGDEVREAFADQGDRVRRGRNLDLKAIARDQLIRAGVETVHDVELCTICSREDLFFSHRRDRGITGRQAGLVWSN